jgi:hypothetical protein
MLENHHQFTQKLLVAVRRMNSPIRTAAMISMRSVERDGLHDDRRLPA